MTEVIQNTERIPFFSVVIPVYNKGPHISRSISSVLNQTYPEFELIVINDASTDDSLEEIKKFDDERIRIFSRNEPGPGGYAARNLGIKVAKGEWIAFLDADDEWYHDHLFKMQELTDKFREIYFISSGWQTQNNGEKKENGFFIKNKSKGPFIIDSVAYLKNCLSKGQPVWTSAVCIKKSSPVVIDIFPAELGAKRGGDLHAWLKMICYHKEMAWSNHLGAVYHQDSTNMVTKNSPASLILMNRDAFKQLSGNLTKKESRLLKKYLNYRIRKHWISRIVNNEPFYLRKHLFWEDIFFNALKYSLLALLPKSVLVFLFRNKNFL